MAWIWERGGPVVVVAGGKRGVGTTMGRQFQFQSQDFSLLSKFSSFHLFLHSLLHIFVLLSSHSYKFFVSICIHLFFFLLSFSQFVPSHSTFFLFHFFILAVCSSKSDFYTTNLFPISISVLCKKIRSLSFVLHSLLGRRNFIVGGLVHTSLVRFIIHLENIALFVINQPINQSINWDYKQN